MSTRESFLARVRQAVKDGNRPGDSAPLPDRGSVGYHGAGAKPLDTFLSMCRAMGAFPTAVAGRDELTAKIAEIFNAKNLRKIMVGRGPVMTEFALEPWVRSIGCEAIAPDASKEERFAIDGSITGVASLIAETGSLVVAAGKDFTRTESLLPRVHIAVARQSQIVADLFDVFENYNATNLPPSNLVFITGPSKTGDIELKLVTGVHGPGEVHVFVLPE